MGPIIVSVKREEHEEAHGALYRLIVRTKFSTAHELVRSEDACEPSVAALTKVRALRRISPFLILLIHEVAANLSLRDSLPSSLAH